MHSGRQVAPRTSSPQFTDQAVTLGPVPGSSKHNKMPQSFETSQLLNAAAAALVTTRHPRSNFRDIEMSVSYPTDMT